MGKGISPTPPCVGAWNKYLSLDIAAATPTIPTTSVAPSLRPPLPWQARGHRCLIFSQFTSMLDILEEYCTARGYGHARLDGETSRVQRCLDVRRFNTPGCEDFVYLISTRAGGLGINLISADTVILYDSDWNPKVKRVHSEPGLNFGSESGVYSVLDSGFGF